MKRLLKFIGLFLMVFIIAFVIDKVKTISKAEVDFPVIVEKNGCLGLNYHRARKDHVATRIVEFLTGSDELKNYSVYESEFEEHIKILKEHDATFVTPDDLRRFNETGKYPKNCVWISFDDVDESVYKNAFPVLKKHQIPFTLFVIAGHVGNDDFENFSLLTWEQIQEMVDSGLATVGSHTYDMHRLVDNKPVFFYPEQKKAFLKDLIKSKETIEANLEGVEVVDFAYPYGDGKEELVPLIKEAGFSSAYILAPRILSKENTPFWQNRILVDRFVFKKTVEPWLKIPED
jgi:intercellular adhesin biosynthesis polysaccharide N-deacetylase